MKPNLYIDIEPEGDIDDALIWHLKGSYGLSQSRKANWEILIERFENAKSNVEKLIVRTGFVKILAIYNSRYIVYSCNLKTKLSGNSIIEFYTNDLFTKTFSKVCHADLEVKPIGLEIVNLDTEKQYRRKGHGKAMIKCIERYCYFNDIEYIYGDYYDWTPIGLDNLIRFYSDNGYEDVNGKRFRKYLE